MIKKKNIIKNRVLSCFCTLFVIFFSFSAHAVCTGPGGVAGQMRYDGPNSTMEYCDDTTWIDMGPSPGAGGAGCTGPSGVEAEMYYNTALKTYQYCDGTNWISTGTEITDPGTSNLKVHWEFEETSGTTASDSTGNTDNNGTLINGPTWSTDAAVGSGSLLFDGSNDYVDIPNAEAVGAISDEATFSNPDQITTFAIWVKSSVTSNGAYDMIFGKLAGANYMAIQSGTNPRLWRGMTKNDDPGTANYFPVSAGTIDWYDKWVHIAWVVEDGVGFKLYINGQLETDVTFTDINLDHWGCHDASNGCNIGALTIAGSKFTGRMDDFRIYDAELSEAEVMYLYSLGSDGCTSPVGVEGEMYYNTTDDAMEYCNGAQWISIGK